MKQFLADNGIGGFIGAFIGFACLFALVLFSNGVGSTTLSQAGKRAGWKWKIIGDGMIAAAIYGFSLLFSGAVDSSTGSIILLGAIIVLGVCANCGFNFGE